MTDTRRPYVSLSIEDLEALYAEHSEDVSVLSQLVQELSIRTTRRARRLLALIADRLSKLEPELESAEQSSEDEASLVENRPVGIEDKPPSYGDDDGSPVQEEPIQAKFAGEQPPDDRKRPERLTRIRPVGTPGLPQPWVRPLDRDKTLTVAANADFPQIYAAALAALISEIKATGAGQKRYELENGVRAAGKEAVYEFPFTDDAELFEDAKVEIEISGRRIAGSIVSISSGRLWLATGEELGNVLKRVVLLVDATALLEALKQKVEEAGKGEQSLNRSIADAVVGKGKPPANPIAIPEAPSGRVLDRAQSNARKRALTASVTYIWGPPGCGKTQVLGEIVRSAFEAEKRILVCSNTNKAVDQVLYRICESLGKPHPAMEGGRIVRVGTIADRKLAGAYNDYVTIDGIVERRSADLKARLSQVQTEIARIDQQSASARAVLEKFSIFDNAQKDLDRQADAAKALAHTSTELAENFQAANERLRGLQTELDKRRNSVLAIFQRSEQTIQRDISNAQEKRSRLQLGIDSMKGRYADVKKAFEQAKGRRDLLRVQLSGLDRTRAERTIAEADDIRAPLVSELREIETKISDLRTAVMKDAKILGTTCTKTYLSVKDIGQVDMVVMDEASMVLLPMAWIVAGLAKERVVVCGDYCQIPPIVQTSQQAVYDVLGSDVFSAAGLVGLKTDDSRMVMLDTQYRMERPICDLIAGSMYGGRLKLLITETLKRVENRRPHMTEC